MWNSFDFSTVAQDNREWRQHPYESAWGGGGGSCLGNVFLSTVLLIGTIFYNHGSTKLPVPVRTCSVVLYTGIAFESRPLKQLLHKLRIRQTGSEMIGCRGTLYV